MEQKLTHMLWTRRFGSSSDLIEKASISKNDVWCMFVIGHYSGKVSDPENIPPFLEKLKTHNINADWQFVHLQKKKSLVLKWR